MSSVQLFYYKINWHHSHINTYSKMLCIKLINLKLTKVQVRPTTAVNLMVKTFMIQAFTDPWHYQR